MSWCRLREGPKNPKGFTIFNSNRFRQYLVVHRRREDKQQRPLPDTPHCTFVPHRNCSQQRGDYAPASEGGFSRLERTEKVGRGEPETPKGGTGQTNGKAGNGSVDAASSPWRIPVFITNHGGKTDMYTPVTQATSIGARRGKQEGTKTTSKWNPPTPPLPIPTPQHPTTTKGQIGQRQ